MGFLAMYRNGTVETVESWDQCLPEPEGARQCLCLVGGGGKSTTMAALTRHWAEKGKKTLATTTTHIGHPGEETLVQDLSRMAVLWDQGLVPVLGTPVGSKLKMPPEEILEAAMELADVTVIEADGAKMLPCKVPRAQEPVLPEGCTLVLAVAGMSALGHPMKEKCFRWELACEQLGVAGDHLLTEEDLAAILAAPWGGRKAVGTRKFAVLLNQCDDEARIRMACRVAARLEALGVDRVILSCYDMALRHHFGEERI